MQNKIAKVYVSIKKNLSSNLVCILIASSGLFLLINEYPYFGILSILIILFLGIIFLFYRGSITSIHYKVLGVLVLIYIYFIVSYFISNQTLTNFLSYDFIRNDGNFFFAYISFFALAVPYFNYEKAIRLYFYFIYFTFSLLSLVGIAGLITRNYGRIFIYNDYEGPMLVGLNHAHNATGSVYTLVCIFALAFMLKSRKKQKIYYSVVLVLCLAGLVMTQSRGAYVGFLAGALFVAWFHYRSILKFVLITIGIAVVSVPLIIFTNMYERFLQILDFTNWTVGTRIEFWQKAFFLIRQSPIFGVGFGRFNDIKYIINNVGYTVVKSEEFTGFPNFFSTYHSPIYRFNTAHAHNSYLQFLAETGIVGLGLIIIFWILCYRIILRGYNNTKKEFSKKVYLASLGSIIVLFIMSLTENYFSATTMLMCLSVVTSLSLGLMWQESKKNVSK